MSNHPRGFKPGAAASGEEGRASSDSNEVTVRLTDSALDPGHPAAPCPSPVLQAPSSDTSVSTDSTGQW